MQCNEKTLPLDQINETNTAPGGFLALNFLYYVTFFYFFLHWHFCSDLQFCKRCEFYFF